MNAGYIGNIFVDMENKENLMVTLSNRRHQNARQQIKTVILESYELFGETFTEEVLSECKEIYSEYKKITE